MAKRSLKALHQRAHLSDLAGYATLECGQVKTDVHVDINRGEGGAGLVLAWFSQYGGVLCPVLLFQVVE